MSEFDAKSRSPAALDEGGHEEAPARDDESERPHTDFFTDSGSLNSGYLDGG
ncbi:hypothetical protein LZC95_50790 [Pendulispora brunnea]|uniref:Uncharacterized protein n=1 Tax=Pendulispora brunnea TaxID=2905690 RepID=A0ABZ2K7N2_9BACT